MPSFSSVGLAALLSTSAYALAPRQAPANPEGCFNIEAVATGEFVRINSGPTSNFTAGLSTADLSNTFTLTNFIEDGSGALFAVDAPGTPSKSVVARETTFEFAPVRFFNQADALELGAAVTQLRCTVGSDNVLACQDSPLFSICGGELFLNIGTEVPEACTPVSLVARLVDECPIEIATTTEETTTEEATTTEESTTEEATSTEESTTEEATSTAGNETMTSISSFTTLTSLEPTATGPVNGTTTAATSGAPTATLVPSAPGTIGNWNLLGCANSPSGFLGWVQVASSPIMTNEFCTVSCTNYKYAGTNGANCYCAVELEDVSTSTYPDSCTAPCPGNDEQACGGVIPANNGTNSTITLARRQLNLFNVLLTTYINAAFEPEVPTVVIGDIIINVDVIVYVDVCNVCAGGLTTITVTSTCSTVACGCETETVPTIPLTTVVRPCEDCAPGGGPSTITVTIPVDAVTRTTQVVVPTGGPGAPGVPEGPGAPGGPGGVNPPGSVGPAPSMPPQFEGAATRREIGGAFGLVAAMIALLA